MFCTALFFFSHVLRLFTFTCTYTCIPNTVTSDMQMTPPLWQKVKWSEVAQSCPTLCDPMDCSPPGSSVHGIFQAWILEWVAFPFSRESSWPRDRTQVSRIVGRHFTVWATREANKSSEHFCHPGMTYSIAPWSMSGVAYYACVAVCKNECVYVSMF